MRGPEPAEREAQEAYLQVVAQLLAGAQFVT